MIARCYWGMGSAARVAAILLLLGCAFSARAKDNAALERGTAAIDPLALRELDTGRFGLARIMSSPHSGDIPVTNRDLFSLPSMAPVRRALDDDVERYVARHKTAFPDVSIGVGQGFDVQMFDLAKLCSPETRFVFSGI